MKQRKRRKYFETQANTERYKRSSIPYMQKLLNKEDRDLKDFQLRKQLKKHKCPFVRSFVRIL